MASMKDFLTAYYNRMIFREMSHEQFVQFCGYIKDKKATDNQKIWAKELLKTDPATGEYITVPNTDIYDPKNMPDPQDPTEGLGNLATDDREWKKLFKAFQNAFQSMDSNKKDFKYNDKATAFLEKYFGSHTTAAGTTIQHMFQYARATGIAKQKIGNRHSPATPVTLYAFLKKHKNRLENHLISWGKLNDDFTYDDLLNGIDSGKYDKDPKFRKNMLSVVSILESYVFGDDTMLRKLGIINANELPVLSDYDSWFDDNITSFRLQQFQAELPNLLNTLRKDSKIREVFSQHDGGKISGPLNKALSNLSYDDPKSEDYVQPKRSDEMSFSETVAEWWGDTYSDVLEKYVKFKGDELFFSPEAKVICKHLSKDLKKTDKLDAVLKNVATTKEKLTAAREFDAIKHLGWFEKTLNEMKADPKMKKIWAGALQHGGKLQALIREVIIKAVKEDKIKEAKTTLELLSVLHFGFTTSKIMDTLGKEEFKLFSDKDLSWNKAKGMQFVTNALDKTIKFAFMGVGYGITAIRNAYQLSQTKIKSYSDATGRLRDAHDQHLQSNADERTNAQNALNANRAQQTTLQGQMAGIMQGRTYDQTETALNNNIATTEGYITNISNSIQNNNIPLLITILNAYRTSGAHPDIPSNNTADRLENYINQLHNALNATPIGNLPTAPAGVSGTVQAQITIIQNKYNNIQNYLTTDQNSKNELDDLINGTETLNQLNALITQQENEISHWDENHTDKMEELVKYWNMLETGRNTKTGPMYNWFKRLSKKKAQKDLDNNKASIIAMYNSSHSIAA
jgi:hypothetical protein